MRNRIIVAAICVPLLFIIVFFLPPYIFVGMVSLICAICAYELLHSIGSKRNDRVVIYSVFSAALIPVGAFFDVAETVFLAVLLVLMFLLFAEAIAVFKKTKSITLSQVLIALLGGALIPLMLSSLVFLRNMPEGHLLTLLPVISAFITDGGAYFTGVFLGKRKAFPLISPKKTVEGCVGGLVVGTLALVAYGAILVFSTTYYIHFWALIICGFIGAVFTELGDLAFSLIKREYDVKDYGRILPGHGGILDRFDSMVFAAPAIYLLVTVIPVF